jgi:Ca2+-binding RTX toxin-like protein
MATIVGFLTVGSTVTGTDDSDQVYGNARGSVNVATGSDRIFGRGGDDFIFGDSGSFENSNGDVVSGDIGPAGRGGDDTVQGGDGDDDIYGDTDSDLLGIGGNDILYQNAGTGTLVGDADVVSTTTRCGNDQLFGDGLLIGDAFEGRAALFGNDVLVASTASGTGEGSRLFGDLRDRLEFNSVGGRDTLKGASLDDLLVGDALTAFESARGGNDTLSGGGGIDRLHGDVEFDIFGTAQGGDDVLRGGAGNDVLFGDGEFLAEFAQGGNDRLTGGAGDDDLLGDGILEGFAQGGRDKFVFSGNFGDDEVFDFRQEDGDQLILKGLTWSEVQISIVTLTDPNDSTLITTLGGDSITLVGYTDGLTAGTDIVFA